MIWQSFITALEMLRMHKLRAFLTMLGVIIGVMAVTIIVMVSSGFQYYLSNEFKKIGSDTIMVVYDRWGGSTEKNASIDSLKMEDADFLRNRVSSIDVVVPMVQAGGQKIVFGDQSIDNAKVNATDENYGVLNGVKLSSGRGLSAVDIATRANVAVIGPEIRERLFPTGKVLGQLISLNGIALEVIGVAERADFLGDSNAKEILMPISTAQDKWLGSKSLYLITTRPKPGIKVDRAMDDVWAAMMMRSGNKRIYRVDSNESILKVFGNVFGVAGAVLSAIAALSLLVGGIGIMNIMLVSVTERTKEIGLRKSVGAKRGAILVQFMVEAGMLSLIGGLIGMGIAFLLGQLVTAGTAAAKWPSEGGLPTQFPIAAALMSALFSALIGIVFGLYPAISASKLDPIVALRRE